MRKKREKKEWVPPPLPPLTTKERIQAFVGGMLELMVGLAFASWIIFMTVKNPEWLSKAVGLAIILFLAALFTSDK